MELKELQKLLNFNTNLTEKQCLAIFTNEHTARRFFGAKEAYGLLCGIYALDTQNRINLLSAIDESSL